MLDLLSDPTTAQAESVRRFYQPELDGLRFYAFLGVFVCHTLPFDDLFYQRLHLPLPWIWGAAARAGGAGVDLFFVLSAYLITSLLLRERQKTGDLSLRLFYVRRTLRIWPLYFLVVALGLVFAHTGGEHDTRWFYYQRLPWYYVLGYVLFVSNWIYAIFGVAQSICAPLWTVSIEEQFYLIWPALMKRAAASRYDHRRRVDLRALDRKPGWPRSGSCESELHRLRQHVTRQFFGLGHPVGALCRSLAEATLEWLARPSRSGWRNSLGWLVRVDHG